VKKSLETSPRTVLSIFVNPSQFSPTEDLSTYPRTLPNDLSLLSSLVEKSRDGSSQASAARASSSDESSAPLVVFAPSAGEMYPNGITTVVSDQKGAFVEVKKYGDVMCVPLTPLFSSSSSFLERWLISSVSMWCD
jgi:pantoate--beta-alanine ligase